MVTTFSTKHAELFKSFYAVELSTPLMQYLDLDFSEAFSGDTLLGGF